MDCTRYQRQLKDIASLFEAEKSRVELITAGHRAGAWEMVRCGAGVRHAACCAACSSTATDGADRGPPFLPQMPAQFCYFKGIRHCFHSAREVGGVPLGPQHGSDPPP